jgi:hypothetical protein
VSLRGGCSVRALGGKLLIVAVPDPAEHLELDPALIDAIATRLLDALTERVVEALKNEGLVPDLSPPKQWLDAAEIAQRLGVTREWVYEHARELGAVRIGQGPRPRLRFPPGQIGTQTSAESRRLKPERGPRRRSRGLIAVYDG